MLKDALGPGQDMILARLHGDKPEYTGVVAGMSGSPVYIDGRLVGALSYRIGQFSKEPIAGITPIESMLQVRDGRRRCRRGCMRAVGERALGVDGQPEMRAMETPLVFGGFSQETVERFGDRFRAMGLTPVAGLGGADPTAVQPEPLVPGSAVSAVLVRGDLSMAGTCTVTYVDPKRLLACGHPITQYGPVDMPMTKATVLAIAGVAAECVQDHQYDGDSGSVYRGPGFGDHGAVWGAGADDSGGGGCGAAGGCGQDGGFDDCAEDASLRGAGQPAADAFDDAGVGVSESADEQYGGGGDELPVDGRD